MDSPFSHFSRHFDFPEIAHVPALKAFEWVGRGWQDLRQSPMASLGHGFLVTMLMVFATEFAYGRPFLFTAMASGFLLAGPLFALCFYEISRAHEAGEATGFGAAFYAWRRNTRSVALFGLILAIIVIAWERVSAILFALLYGGGMPAMETSWKTCSFPAAIRCWLPPSCLSAQCSRCSYSASPWCRYR